MRNITILNLLKKESIKVLFIIYLPGILFLGLMILFSHFKHIEFSVLSRDTAAVLNGSPYVGMISSIGMILWSFSSAILLFTFKLANNNENKNRLNYFFLFSGCLSLIMLFDDFFQLHEAVFPHFHINEKLFYVFYGLSVILISGYYYHFIKNTDNMLFVFAFLFLALSGLFSEFGILGIGIDSHILEDGFKFLGIISWSAYFTRTSYKFAFSLPQVAQEE